MASTIASISFAYVDHDFFETPRARLIKAIGLPCCYRIAPIPSPEASVSTVKVSLKFGMAKIDVVVMAFLSV
jgi:hypothetical protein